MYDKDSDEFRYILPRDYVRLWDDRNIIHHEATDIEHCPMGTRFLLCKEKVLRPKQNWTNVNKTKVSDTQFNQSKQEDSVDDARMMVISPGVYSHLQVNAVGQQQMAHLKNQTRSQI